MKITTLIERFVWKVNYLRIKANKKRILKKLAKGQYNEGQMLDILYVCLNMGIYYGSNQELNCTPLEDSIRAILETV